MFREPSGSRHRITSTWSTLATLVLLTAPAVASASDWTDGVAAFQAGNLDEAEAAFARHVERAPNQYQGHLMLGQVLLQRGGVEKAVGHLQRADELAPDNAGVLLPLAKALLAVERRSEACRTADQIDGAQLDERRRIGLLQLEVDANCSGDPLPHLEEIAQLTGRAHSWAQLGSAARRLDDTQLAIAAFDRAVELAPADAKIRRNQFAALAEHTASLGDSADETLLQRLVISAGEVVRLEPTVAHRMQLAEAHLLAASPEAALQALSTVEGTWRADWIRARALGSEALGRYGEALGFLDRALRSGEADQLSTLHGLRGYNLAKLQRYDEAIAAYLAAGDDDAAAQVRAQQRIAAENAAIDRYNNDKTRIQTQVAKVQQELEDAKGPPR